MTGIHFFPDNVDTDLIMPGQFLSLSDPQELARYCMYGFDANLASKVAPGDIFVAGNNFGCGSSREHAPLSIKALGVQCVIAKSFARIFYRNAINLGLPVIQCPQAVENITGKDEVTFLLQQGKIINKTKNEEYDFAQFQSQFKKYLKPAGS